MDGGKGRYRLLHGLRVLDLSDDKASLCSKILADMGSAVIKVVGPGVDDVRKRVPDLEEPVRFYRDTLFSYRNSNKQRVTLDLEQQEGRKDFLQLVKTSDILIETYPPGYLFGLGLDYEKLTEINSGLIWVSVTGFGQSGPRSPSKSCDLVAAAYGGAMSVTGSPSLPPLKLYGEQSYYTASLFAAIGIFLALQERRQTGKGNYIDISLQEAVAATLDHVIVRHLYDKTIPERQGSIHWNHFFVPLPCKDGDIHATPFYQWETLVEWIGSDGMAGDLADKKWKDETYRIEHIDHVMDILGCWTKKYAKDDLFGLAQLMRFPWAPIYSPEEVVESPQLKARRFLVDMDHPEIKKPLKVPGLPYRFGHDFKAPQHPASAKGRRNDRVGQKGTGPEEEILKGIRVLDFTRVLAGPYATGILADFGAEVIKVQSKKIADRTDADQTSYYDHWNRNKKSMMLDMSRPEAKQIILKLVTLSDVVVDNFSPRVMSNWGLDYEILRKAKDDLIMLSMSGMGQTGPWKDFVAFGPTIQSLSGMTYLTSYDQDSPMGPGYSYADHVAGLYGALAVLAALEYRDRTGEGQYIDVSEYEAMCTLIVPALLEVPSKQGNILPQGNRADYLLASPYGCYPCLGENNWCAICIFNQEEWLRLCKIIGKPGWSKEERFSSVFERKKNIDEIDDVLAQWTSKRSRDEVGLILQQADIPAGIIQNARDLVNDTHLLEREFFVNLKHPKSDMSIAERSPIRFSNKSLPSWKSAPSLGEDNHYVYTELLGFTESQLFDYVQKGIIG